MLHEMTVTGLAIDPATNAPILILSAKNDEFTVPIWIGLMEAASIASVLQGIDFERPMTHDLFKNFLDRLNVTVSRIEICDLKNNTFFAKIYCHATDEDFIMDARPSDAIALGLRLKADIFVEDSVVNELKTSSGNYEAVDESDQGKKWEEYLKNLDPDDFGKYKV
jgi:uncharacterized protein